MQEALKKVTSNLTEPADKSVTLCIRSQRFRLNGIWRWEMQSPAVYCSNVMDFPDDFEGTKGIIHPDDLPNLLAAVSMMEEKEIPDFDFRIITTYGEVKTIAGQRISIDEGKNNLAELLPGREPWEEVLQELAEKKELDFLHLRKELSDITERLHSIGSWLMNKHTGETWYSDNVFRIYGLAPQSLNAHVNTFHSFIHPEDKIAVLDAFEKAYVQEVSLHIEYRIVTSETETQYVQQICKWMYNQKGQILLVGILRDVTQDRIIADELLAAQSKTLLGQQVLKFSEQQSLSAYWHINLLTRQTSFSDNYQRIFGFKQNYFPSYKSFLNLVHPEDKERVNDVVEKMYSEHVMPETEFRIIRPDGKMRYIKQSGKVFVSPANEMIMIGVVQDITVQKGLEKKIQELNEAMILTKTVSEMTEEIANLSFIVWLPDGYMQWSESFYRLLGHKPGGIEPLPRALYRYIHPSDLKKFKDTEALLVNGQNHESIVIRIVSKTGTKLLRISFRQMNYGKEAVIGLVQDVSKQNFMQDEFAQTKAYADMLTDTVNDIVIYTNTDNTVLYWNEKAEKKTGISRSEALRHNLFEILPRLNEEDFLRQLHLATRGQEMQEAQTLNRYIRQLHNYWLYPLRGEEGEVIGVLHIVQDVSKQQELKQQLSERLAFIETLLESSVDRIVALDRFMNYLYWNARAEKHYGLNKEQVLGKNILEIFPSFRNQPGYNEFRRVLKGETVYLPPVLSEETDEYSETYLSPIKNEDNEVTAVLWIVHDLTEQKKTQQELFRLKDEVAQKTTDKYYSIFNSIDEGFCVIQMLYDAEGRPDDWIYLEANPTFERQHGFNPIGKKASEVAGSIEPFRLQFYNDVLRTGRRQEQKIILPPLVAGTAFMPRLLVKPRI